MSFAVGYVGQALSYKAWSQAVQNESWWLLQPMAMYVGLDSLFFNVLAFQWTPGSEGGGLGLARSQAAFFEIADDADPALRQNQDCVAPGVCLTRDSAQGLYNAAFQRASAGPFNAPAGTLWAPKATAEAKPSDYTSFAAATGNAPVNMIGKVMSLHIVGSSIYYDVVFTNWSDVGTGFSYARSRAIVVGCTDPSAPNYDPRATVDDGYCGDWVRVSIPTDPDLDNPEHRDCLTPNVCISRGVMGSWFNIASETGYVSSRSPAGTLWASKATLDAQPSDYGLWSTRFGCPSCVLNQTFSVWIPSEGRAFDVVLLRWAESAGGGVSYLRREVALSNTCGNGIVEVGEECDDQNDDETDGCLSNCLRSGCGNGVVEDDEECDEGAGNSAMPGGTCRLDCTLAGCGDGIVDPGEICDDGNIVDGDGCDSTCVPSCGAHTGAVLGVVRERDGMCVMAFDKLSTGLRLPARCAAWGGTAVTITDGDENKVLQGFGSLLNQNVWIGLTDTLEEGEFVWASGDPSTYRAWDYLEPNGETRENCVEVNKGSGLWNDLACDEQRLQACETTCGNGTLEPDEECDEGPNNSNAPGAACRTNCRKEPACGDGILDPGEDCDDGNQNDGDGCTATCTLPCAKGTGALAAVVSPTDGRCFALFDDPLVFAKAQSACEALGGSLATIANAGDNAAAATLIKSAGDLRIWIGFNDIVQEGHFVWASGATSTYTNWGGYEPNNAEGIEDCTEMRANGSWNDVQCWGPRPYLCELPE